MTERDMDRLLAGLVPTPPPPETRERALAAAREVGALETEPEDAWSRLWQSRPARLAWGAAVAVLLLAHAVLSLRGPAAAGAPASPAHLAVHAEAARELAAIAELPPLRLGLLPIINPSGRRAGADSHRPRLSSRRPS